MTRIILPNGWKPRPYQMPMWSYLENGGKRAIGAWHRRAGKDDVLLNWTAVAAFERPASYWHCLPEYSQARKAIWTAVDPMTGVRRIDQAFPHELRANTNDQEMFIRFKNGSTWQCVGSDRYNSLVGAGVAGVTFSEFALANPSAWAYIRPMVEANDGWAAFISTPRGRNHFRDLMQMASKNKSWFQEVLSVESTGALTKQQIEESKAEYIALYGEDLGNAQFEQEYMVSFNAAIMGAFYAREMQALRSEGRILDTVEPLEGFPVHRAWDIGVKDDTSIWWFQVVGQYVLILDCYSQSGVGLDHYVDIIHKIRDERGWLDGIDYVPHDAKVKEWTSGKTRVETMMELGLNPRLVPMASKLDGINAVRRTLPKCVFHTRCEAQGIAALEQYRREWDDDKKTFKASEVHDWSSHLADAFRYLSLSWQATPTERVPDHVKSTRGAPRAVDAIYAPPIDYGRKRRR
jgi:phage terminase large subunit